MLAAGAGLPLGFCWACARFWLGLRWLALAIGLRRACAGLALVWAGLRRGLGWEWAGLALDLRWAFARAGLVLLRSLCCACAALVLVLIAVGLCCLCRASGGLALGVRGACAGLPLGCHLHWACAPPRAARGLCGVCAGLVLGGLCWACAGLELGLGWAWAALVLLAAHTQPVQQVDGHQVHRARYPPLPVTHPMSPAGPWPPDETIAFGQPAPHPRR